MKMGRLRGDNSTHLIRIGAALLPAILLVGGMLFLLVGVVEAEVGPADEERMTPEAGELLAIYVLAFDNRKDSSGAVNLTPKYTATVQGIVSATVGQPHVTAVILADLDADGDTRVLISREGMMTPTVGLPDQGGTLDPDLTEYDTTSGHMLGGFLQWARQEYPADRTIFSYISHGSALTPATDPPIADLVITPGDRIQAPLDNAIPMPTRVDIHPDFTDMNVPAADTARMITPHDLALALRTAQEVMGGEPIDVIDLVHCFAASIEELYEVGSYAKASVAAPNYTFFTPEMAGAALAAVGDMDISETATAVAGEITSTYYDVIPSARHPFIMVAVDNTQLPDVKEAWDQVAAGLMAEFAADPAGTATALADTYLAAAGISTVYDTTFCQQEPDFDLAPPDALSDMANFANELRVQFPDLADEAEAARQAINTAVIASPEQNGEPWWDPTPERWDFNSAYGIALFTPFQPMMVDGAAYHPWQALWYTSALTIAQDVSIGDEVMDVFNPDPYQFVQSSTGEVTWADVLHRFWQVEGINPRSDVPTALCLPEIQEAEAPDLTLTLQSGMESVLAGSPVTYTAEVVNQTTLLLDGVVLTYTLPGEVTATAVPSECRQAGRRVICEMGALAGHQKGILSVTGLVDRHAAGPMWAAAAATAVQPDAHPEDNTAVARMTVEPLIFIYVPTILD